jgi:hypothetical protein
MTKKKLFDLMLGESVLLLMLSGLSLAFNEPDNFRGAKWGMTPEEVQQQKICGEGLGPSELLGARTKSKDPRVRLFSCSEFVRVGPVEVFLLLRFLDNGLSRIDLSFKPSDFTVLEAAFRERYGEPTSARDNPIKTRAGVSYNQRELLWSGNNVLIRLRRYSGRVTSSDAALSTVKFRQYLEEKSGEDSKDASKDL